MSRDSGRVRHELTLGANLLGGYDDNLTAGTGAGPGVVPTAMASGTTQSLDATLGYFHGNTSRSIRMESTGNLLAYPGYLKRPAAGGGATIEATTRLGRNAMFGASERVGYQPLFNVLSPGISGAPLPAGLGQAVPAPGLFERRSRNSATSVSLERFWSGRDSTSFSYSYGVQQFTSGARGDNSAHDVRTEYRRRVTGELTARAGYGYTNRGYTDFAGASRPTVEHRIQGGPEIEKTFSRRRHLRLSLSAGASYIESIGPVSRERVHAWVPVGSGSAALGLSSLWSLEGGYTRGFSPLQGLTDQVYTTDTAFLTSRVLMTRRTDVRVGATFGNWKTSLAPGLDDRLNVFGGSLQVNVALTRRVAATAGYFYYQHRYSNPGVLPAGFPPVYDRQAVRVGLTMNVPLAGASSPSPLIRR